MVTHSDSQCSCSVPDPRELSTRWVSLYRSHAMSRPWPVRTQIAELPCNQKGESVLQKWTSECLTTEHTCCRLASLSGIKQHGKKKSHLKATLLWQALPCLLRVFVLVEMADGQFRCFVICLAGGQRLLSCGLTQLHFYINKLIPLVLPRCT